VVGKYRLTVAGYNGYAGDAMAAAETPEWTSNSLVFSTPDSDNDLCACNCGADYGSGWWFGSCSSSRLNVDTNAVWTTDAPLYDIQTSHMLVKLN